MSGHGSVTAEQLARALERRGATLPAEIATFVVLEACEAMLASGPRNVVGLAELRISEHGATSVSGAASDEEAGARSLHRCLAALLAPVQSRLSPALARLVERGPAGGSFSLKALRDELEAALVPLNRNASRRVLARFARDATEGPDALEVQAALKSLIDTLDEPDNDVANRPSHARLHREHGDAANDELVDGEASFLGGPVSTLREPTATEPPAPTARPRRVSGPPLRPLGPLLSEEADAARSRWLFLGFSVLALAVTATTLVLTLRKDGDQLPRASRAPAFESDEAVRADLVVNVPERDVQILRFIGHAPVELHGVRIGVPHEYVATLDGHLPARALIPAQADWEATPSGARYEVALQLAEASDGPARTLDLGPSRMPEAEAGTATDVGTVRVIATPRGARVYELIGFSPSAELRDFTPGEVEEILIYREGSPPVVRTVRSEDYRNAGARRTAEITLSLTVPP